MPDPEHAIRQFLIDSRRWLGAPAALSTDLRLIENDVLDSLGIFETIAFLEDHFAIQVEDDDLLPENFETLKAISQLVERRRI